jgi:NOL1/NOP2/fmu family ribosome biogenesis protein
MKLSILSKKEIKKILSILEKHYGFTAELDYTFLWSSREKLYLVSPDFQKIDDTKLRIDSLGLYFAFYNDKELRLTIDGSQLIGPHAKKGIIEIDSKDAGQWLRGYDLDIPYEKLSSGKNAEHPELIEAKDGGKGFLLVKHCSDFMGSGKLKDGKLLNHIPKTRRIMASA